MRRTLRILYPGHLHSFFLVVTLLIICSCTQDQGQPSFIAGKKDTLKPPVVMPVKPPVEIDLDTCPLPTTIAIPTKRGGNHIIKSDAGVRIPAGLDTPEIFTADFLLQIKNYNTEHGLAISGVLSSFCDEEGNLWFGTNGGGVSRYDGKSFTNFTTTQGLSDNEVSSIIEDKNKNLWFGTIGGGVSRYDGRSFSNFTTKQGLARETVYKIFEDYDGNLWFATNNGVFRLDNDKKNFPNGKISFTNYTTADGLVSNNVTSIAEDKNGNLWFTTADQGVSRYDGKLFTNYTTKEGLSNNSVSDILTDSSGILWIASYGGGISCYDGNRFTNYTTKQGLISNHFSSLFEDKNGDLWFGTRGEGVSRLDHNTKGFTNYNTKHGFTSANIWSIVQDKTSNLWFCSFGSGVARLSKSIASSDFLLLSIFEDQAGHLWLGGDGDGLFQLNRKENSVVQYGVRQGMKNNHVTSIIEDKKGNLWCGTLGGVSQFDPLKRSFTTYTTAQGLASDEINRIYEDKSGAIWFGTIGGLSRLDSSKKQITNYSKAQGLAGNYVSGILRDEKNNLWICTDEGVSKYDGKTFTNYTTDQGLANNDVINILEDKMGNFWFATNGGGLSRLDKQQNAFINFTTEEGLGDDNLTAIAVDTAGTIWLGSSKGFTALKGFTSKSAVISKKDFVPAANEFSNSELESNYEPVFEVYNNKTDYAVKAIQYNVMCITRDDIMWAGTSDKLIRFDYHGIRKNSDPPNVFIQNIKLNNENISWYDLEKNSPGTDSAGTNPNIAEEVGLFGKPLSEPQRDIMRQKYNALEFDSIARFYPVPLNLTLPYDHNDITFDFAAIEPSRPGLVLYQYILEGYDDDWSSLNNKTSVSFGNISEGKYTFKLKAQSPDGTWSQPVIYTFKVLPPWWRTWWAYTLYALLFVFIMWNFIKWRERTLKKDKLFLEEKVVIRTHELQEEKEKVESTLSELKATQSQLIHSEKMASLGELTAGIAHEIQNPLNFVNNFSEVSNELLDEMNEELNKGDIDEAKVISHDIKQNLEKINHHGKRADAIVKGMLQHSRSSSGIKEATDINALADEYLRLAYHGLRAKDKSFNATLETNFDHTIGKVNIIPQDIGRVILNLITNAFYAVTEKTKKNIQGYEPTVTVTTRSVRPPSGGWEMLISVRDNGDGIPQTVLDKIFQPFFTTKPTGQGTGLGLSLSYDIVKAHGGELKVKSNGDAGAEFVIQLPIQDVNKNN